MQGEEGTMPSPFTYAPTSEMSQPPTAPGAFTKRDQAAYSPSPSPSNAAASIDVPDGGSMYTSPPVPAPQLDIEAITTTIAQRIDAPRDPNAPLPEYRV